MMIGGIMHYFCRILTLVAILVPVWHCSDVLAVSDYANNWGCNGNCNKQDRTYRDFISEDNKGNLFAAFLADDDNQKHKDWCIGEHSEITKDGFACHDSSLKIIDSKPATYGSLGMLAVEIDEHCALFCPRQIGMSFSSKVETRVKITMPKISKTSIESNAGENEIDDTIMCVWLCHSRYFHNSSNITDGLVKVMRYEETRREDTKNKVYHNYSKDAAKENAAREVSVVELGAYTTQSDGTCTEDCDGWQHKYKEVLIIEEWLKSGHGAYVMPVVVIPHRGSGGYYTEISEIPGTKRVLACSQGYVPNKTETECVNTCSDNPDDTKVVKEQTELDICTYKGTFNCNIYMDMDTEKIIHRYEMHKDGNNMYCKTGYYGNVTSVILQADDASVRDTCTNSCSPCRIPKIDNWGKADEFVASNPGYIQWVDDNTTHTSVNNCVFKINPITKTDDIDGVCGAETKDAKDCAYIYFDGAYYQVFTDTSGNKFIIPEKAKDATANTCSYQ